VKRATKQTPYRYGVQFERRVRADLEKRGYVTVRAAGSHGPIDLVALSRHAHLIIQCKTNGRLNPAAWNALLTIATSVNALAVLASSPGRGCVYHALVTRKDVVGKAIKEQIEP
jgi:Holliday junction resolvase